MSDDGPAPAGGPPAAGAGSGAAVGSTQNGGPDAHRKETESEKKPIITKAHFETDITLSRPLSTKSSVDLEDYFVRGWPAEHVKCGLWLTKI